MGDRGNIYIEDMDIYFYTHGKGSITDFIVASALDRGRDRWDDDSYLARIIFSELIKDNLMGTTGYGISRVIQDENHPPTVVNITNNTVNGTPFEQFVQSFVEFKKATELNICEICGAKGNNKEGKTYCRKCWEDIALDSCEKGECNHPICHGEEEDETNEK